MQRAYEASDSAVSEMAIVDTFTKLIFGEEDAYSDRELGIIQAFRGTERVFEAGCGTGFGTEALLSKLPAGTDYRAVDLSGAGCAGDDPAGVTGARAAGGRPSGYPGRWPGVGGHLQSPGGKSPGALISRHWRRAAPASAASSRNHRLQRSVPGTGLQPPHPGRSTPPAVPAGSVGWCWSGWQSTCRS